VPGGDAKNEALSSQFGVLANESQAVKISALRIGDTPILFLVLLGFYI
jgi:hypothetical protein